MSAAQGRKGRRWFAHAQKTADLDHRSAHAVLPHQIGCTTDLLGASLNSVSTRYLYFALVNALRFNA